MALKRLRPDSIALDTDWEGNNAAFTCPVCGKVYVVSGMRHIGGRDCPHCGKSSGHVNGGKNSGGTAYIRYDEPN